MNNVRDYDNFIGVSNNNNNNNNDNNYRIIETRFLTNHRTYFPWAIL